MAFEIKSETARGIFHVKLLENVSTEQMIQLCQLAENIVGTQDTIQTYGPKMSDGGLVSQLREENSGGVFSRRPKNLGENPVQSIHMGPYKEPEGGVRLKFVHVVQNIAGAVKILRKATGISMMGCKEIIDGNVQCPRISPAMIESLTEEFEKIRVYVKVIEAA